MNMEGCLLRPLVASETQAGLDVLSKILSRRKRLYHGSMGATIRPTRREVCRQLRAPFHRPASHVCVDGQCSEH